MREKRGKVEEVQVNEVISSPHLSLLITLSRSVFQAEMYASTP